MNDGLSAYVGFLLASKDGYSLAACGFVQASFTEKFTFSNVLSFRSKSKKFLSRLSYLWVCHFLLLALTIFSCVTLHSEQFRSDTGKSRCVVYSQDGEPNDRGYPTLEIEMGVGEYVFGSSLGLLRSEAPVNITTVVFAPQLTDTLQHKAAIAGIGYQLDVSLF